MSKTPRPPLGFVGSKGEATPSNPIVTETEAEVATELLLNNEYVMLLKKVHKLQVTPDQQHLCTKLLFNHFNKAL